MNRTLILFILIQISGLTLFSVNQMDLIQTMTGEHLHSNMGNSLASLDFNGDGYDDLIVCSNNWGSILPPDNISYGKIYFYFGGPSFDSIAEMNIVGSYTKEYRAQILDLGDVNGDSIHDLGIVHSGRPNGLDPGNPKFSIIYGGQQQPLQINYSIVFDYYQHNYIGAVSLGDINRDGFDDIGLILPNDFTVNFRIIWGGNFQSTDLNLTGQSTYSFFFNGVGDVNNDGFDDFSIGYCSANIFTVTIYYGGTQLNLQNHLEIYNSPTYILMQSIGVGDVNGDGIDDFVGYASTTNANMPFWLGSQDPTSNFNLSLSPFLPGSLVGQGITSGDFNNDGFNDIFGTNPGYNWNSGRAGLWIGRQSFNGTLDYTINAPDELNRCNFGLASTVGDFNGDGFDDYAISAPTTESTWFEWSGKVYVYAGNALLADTTVENDDNTIPIINSLMEVYPNPITLPRSKLKIVLHLYLSKVQGVARLFDVKGRLINTQEFFNSNIEIDVLNTTPGVYILQVNVNDQVIRKKIAIL